MRRERLPHGGALAPLSDSTMQQLNALLPPHWSRNNPVDLAGGETRDTIPEVLELIASHPEVDAVIQLGLGIQANQARLMRIYEGPTEVHRMVVARNVLGRFR